MFFVQKFFNYFTLILAICTIGLCIYTVIKKTNPGACIILMSITIIFNTISRIYNNRNVDLKKEDLEMLKKK